jgi:hypothetical protein
MKALKPRKTVPSKDADADQGANRKLTPQIGQLGEMVRTVGLVGIVFGVNPLSAHMVVYAGGPPLLAYGFASFCMLLFCSWWMLKAFPPFKNTVL